MNCLCWSLIASWWVELMRILDWSALCFVFGFNVLHA